MTKDTAGRIRARRILNDKILSARVQVAIDKKLGNVETPKNIVALAKLNVPKGPIEFKGSFVEIEGSGRDRSIMTPRQGAVREPRAASH